MNPAIALPRRRTKRRRPPSDRLIWGVTFLALILANIAHLVIRVLDGELVMVIPGLLWIALYSGVYRLHRAMQATEAAGSRVRVRKVEWINLGVLWMVLLVTWGVGV